MPRIYLRSRSIHFAIRSLNESAFNQPFRASSAFCAAVPCCFDRMNAIGNHGGGKNRGGQGEISEWSRGKIVITRAGITQNW